MLAVNLTHVKIQHIFAGNRRSHVIDMNNNVYGFGGNRALLGFGKHDENSVTIPELIPLLCNKSIHSISIGRDYSLALGNGLVYSWGFVELDRSGAALGRGRNRALWIPPKEISFFLNKFIRKISSGYEDSIAVEGSQHVYAFGENSEGNLGLGDDDPRFVPHEATFFTNRRVTHIGSSIGPTTRGFSIVVTDPPIEHYPTIVYYCIFIIWILPFFIILYGDVTLLNSRIKISQIIHMVPKGRKKEYFTIDERVTLLNKSVNN